MPLTPYRGYFIDVVPGMCCPSVRIRQDGATIQSFPCNDPHLEGERKARALIDYWLDDDPEDGCPN